jgi:valyl-tRNA synthetase
MEIKKQYEAGKIEKKWYRHWMEKGYFYSTPDEREPYTIVIPPPNVTGVLHMGHMLNNTLQDVLVRRARLLGKNACWVPGTDHASIATEAKVVAKLKSEGIDKNDISREAFLEHAWEWTHKHGGIILEQLKKLGASCDWNRTAFTMDETRSESVIRVFIDLFEKGLIYRGYRMVNWDPEAKTTVSDEEVIYKEVQSKLYYLRYPIEGEDGFVTIATTRPETILGDTAVCVNPADERFSHLKGKRVIVPVANRSIPIIEDEYVDIEFGTGCLKITPAHDPADKEIGEKHQLEVLDILNDDGTLNALGLHYEGLDRFEVRKKIVEELDQKGNLVKAEDYVNNIGTSERTGAIIEPKISIQWFMSMKKISEPALKSVMEDDIKLIPAKFKNTYRHWMENVRDWCISRQLYWGHRIPAWYFGDKPGDFVVANDENEALKKAIEKTGNAGLKATDLKQDPDVLDTWFSSWLWPISVFDGIRKPDNEDINYYYPTDDLVTAPEILFFWVARMIIAGYEYRNDKPFKNVYLTGIVRDKQGRKMSKSLGNSPDPLELIEKYSADGVRVGMLLTSPAGNDLPFDVMLCEQGRNFNNKVWNAMRLIKGWAVEPGKNPDNETALNWFGAKLNQTILALNKSFDNYYVSEALKSVYTLVWDDFCSWLLEMVKPGFEQPVDQYTFDKVIDYFEKVLKLLHPFMPFITEEIWHLLRERNEGDDIIVSRWPAAAEPDKSDLLKGETIKKLVTTIRDIKVKNSIKPRETVDLYVLSNDNAFYGAILPVVKKLAWLGQFENTENEIEDAVTFIVNKHKFFVLLNKEIDVEQEKARLQKEIEYTKGFIKSVGNKLKNERFVNNAPAQVVEKERIKMKDGEQKLEILEKTLNKLSAKN